MSGRTSLKDFLIVKSIETGNKVVFENNIRDSKFVYIPLDDDLMEKLVENEDILHCYLSASTPKIKKYIVEWVEFYSDIEKINPDKLESIEVDPRCIASIIRKNKLVYLEKLFSNSVNIMFHEDGELMDFHRDKAKGIAFLRSHSLKKWSINKSNLSRGVKFFNEYSTPGSVFLSSIIGYCVLLRNKEAFEFFKEKYPIKKNELMLMVKFGRFEMFEKHYTPDKDIPMYKIEYIQFNDGKGTKNCEKLFDLIIKDKRFFDYVTLHFSEEEKELLKEWKDEREKEDIDFDIGIDIKKLMAMFETK